jgi:hypothetical protein
MNKLANFVTTYIRVGILFDNRTGNNLCSAEQSEREHKIRALIDSKGDFDLLMKLSNRAFNDMMWWYETVAEINAPIRRINPQLDLFTDASLTGWGAVLGAKRTGGNWTEAGVSYAPNISYLELFAIFLINVIILVLVKKINVWLSAVYLPGKDNVDAEKKSANTK